MATLLEQSENLKKLDENTVFNQIFKALKKAQTDVLNANREQLSQGKRPDNTIVGVYAKATEGFANRDSTFTSVEKKQGQPYNFQWTAEFFKGFQLDVSGDEATISSTGVGSGGKQSFLTQSGLFGLSDDALSIVIRKDILPFINNFARKTLNI